MDTRAWLAIFAIMENNHRVLSKWRPGGILYASGVGLAMLILPVSIKDHTIIGASDKIERMPLT